MLTHLHKKFLGNTAAFESILFCIRNVRFYSKSEIPNESPDCILLLLKGYGFTHEEASTFISKKPILLSYTTKTLKPKLDFFRSVNMSLSDLGNILSVDPSIFKSSLQNQIIPRYEYLKSVLKTNENVNHSIRRSTRLSRTNLQKYLAPNLAVLRECGVPSDKIVAMLKTQPRSLIQDPDRFVEVVRETKKMGFDPDRSNFVLAIQIITGFSKSSIERKKGIYKKWGWSDEEILAAFMKTPNIMGISDKKIEAVMNFLVNKMGWNASQVAECHYATMHSLENWTAPRCLVYQFLLSKGLIKKEIPLTSLIKPSKEKFSSSYVAPYSAQFPELLTFFESTENKSLELES